MLSLHSSGRYFLYREPINILKSFYSLAAIVRDQMHQDPLTTDVFIFRNRSCTQIKLLQWQQDGFCIYYKKLERGTFEVPVFKESDTHISISNTQLLLILEGISLNKVHYRKRYQQKIFSH